MKAPELLYPQSCLLAGLALLAIGASIRYRIGKRRFNRRGMGGLQQFSSYSSSVWTTLWENLLGFFAFLCVVTAIGLFLLAGCGYQIHH